MARVGGGKTDATDDDDSSNMGIWLYAVTKMRRTRATVAGAGACGAATLPDWTLNGRNELMARWALWALWALWARCGRAVGAPPSA